MSKRIALDYDYFSQWLFQSSRATFSTNQKWNQNQSWLAHAHFPAICVGYVKLLRVLIGLLDCLRPFWLAKLITLGLVLRHSIETRSKDSPSEQNWKLMFNF